MTSVLTNATEFRFGDISLHGALLEWNDAFEFRFAKFEYLKRHGATQEPLGASAARFTFQCVYMGKTATQDYQQLLHKLRTRPGDLLFHPRLGRIEAVCKGLRSSERPAQSIDTIEFSLDFEENELDQTFSALLPGPIAGAVNTARQNAKRAMDSLFPPNKTSSPLDRVNQMIAIVKMAQSAQDLAADRFSTAAQAIANLPTLDPQLPSLLGAVQTKTDTLISALRQTGRTDAELFPWTSAVRSMYASCIHLYQAVMSQKPPVVTFTVPASMSLSEICLALYGGDARDSLPQVQQLNPLLRTPYCIPAGTVLQVYSPNAK